MNRTKLIISIILVTCCSFALGLIIGHFAISKLSSNDSAILSYYKELIQDDENASILDKIIQLVSIDNLKMHLKLIILSILSIGISKNNNLA
jgi:uncharacterized membrane protein SpoIIM required for sporulation